MTTAGVWTLVIIVMIVLGIIWGSILHWLVTKGIQEEADIRIDAIKRKVGIK